jgi:hypothetical protein
VQRKDIKRSLRHPKAEEQQGVDHHTEMKGILELNHERATGLRATHSHTGKNLNAMPRIRHFLPRA